MNRSRLSVSGREVDVWLGGEGQPLLLLHGGWAGAQAHWEPVWDGLALQHRVIAPDLPGIVDHFDRALPTYEAYGRFLKELLEALGAQGAIVCGNSLGASIAWDMASRHNGTVARAVLVDGFPPRPPSGPVRWMMGVGFLRRMAERQLRRSFYSPDVFDRAFHDLTRIPPELRDRLEAGEPGMAATMLTLLMSVDEPTRPPRVPVDFIWGANDRLDGVTAVDGRVLSSRVPGSKLVLVKDAGHLPQVDNPGGFLAAFDSVASHRSGGGAG
ncbi:alpha/beta fold hydrolase [Ancylobacter terrae]|uniref:alpha/beta fold hydrolase n=1 Tax=Ancylobacter sp. sgz301288 TaxID=3342077 RepID=UPI003859C1CE